MEIKAQLMQEAPGRSPQRYEFGPVQCNININGLEQKDFEK